MPRSPRCSPHNQETTIKARRNLPLFTLLVNSLLILLTPFAWSDTAGVDVDVNTSVDLGAAVQSALNSVDNNDLDANWYYSMNVLQDEEQQVIHSNPKREPAARRELIEVNGAAPDDARKQEFRDAEKKRLSEQDEATQKFNHLVDMETLNLLEVREGIAEFAFIPRIPQFEEARESLRGKLLLDTQNNEITRLEIFNIEKLSPAFSVSVDDFRLVFNFAPQEGVQLLQHMETRARGKAGFVKSFDSSTTVSIGDYRRIGE